MFGLVRLLIGCILFICAVLVIKRFKAAHKNKKYVISAIVAVALTAILAFLPFENIFVTFDSPECVYRYVSFGNSDVKLVVDGQDSDLVIGDNNGADVYLIVPKTSDGWKIGIGANTKRVAQKIADGVVIYVYQYKDTRDYFVTVLDTAGGPIEIAYSCNSEFVSLERANDSLDKIFTTHYASIPNIDQQYWVKVNGEDISVFDK